MWADVKKLQGAGYTVEERSVWHYQVIAPNAVINIWPSKKKYMREWGSGASFYTDVVAAVEAMVGKPGQKRDVKAAIARKQAWWQTQIPVPRDPEAYEAWRYEIDLLVAYIGRVWRKNV